MAEALRAARTGVNALGCAKAILASQTALTLCERSSRSSSRVDADGPRGRNLTATSSRVCLRAYSTSVLPGFAASDPASSQPLPQRSRPCVHWPGLGASCAQAPHLFAASCTIPKLPAQCTRAVSASSRLADLHRQGMQAPQQLSPTCPEHLDGLVLRSSRRQPASRVGKPSREEFCPTFGFPARGLKLSRRLMLRAGPAWVALRDA